MGEFKIINGDSLVELDKLAENSIDSIVTDPPYELNFMNKGWDNSGISFNKEIWEKCLRVLKPGGHLLAFGGSRTSHRIACAIEDAGFEIRDTIMWLYGCYSEDTKVLTSSGYKYFKDLKDKDMVMQFNSVNQSLSWCNPLDYFVYDIDGKMVNIKTEHSDQLITPNHKVIYRINNVIKESIACILPIDEDIYLPIYKDNKIEWEKIVSYNELQYKGKIYCVKTKTGALVVNRKNQPFISGNSGFPKSMNIGLAIDKKNGVESKVVETKTIKKLPTTGIINYEKEGWRKGGYDIEYQKREAQNEWKGWGTCLKPSYEPIIVARKPFKGSLVDNVIEYGVGGLNIDECRVDYNGEIPNIGGRAKHTRGDGYGFKALEENCVANTDGRFPANTILTYNDTDFDEVCGGMPNSKGSVSKELGEYGFCFDEGKRDSKPMAQGYGDEGSASRYFYCAKASKRDRDEGLDSFEESNSMCDRNPELESANTPMNRSNKPRKNTHPTVKPTSLIQYLVKLVTPKGGVVLDPFNGSGSTGKAVAYENKDRNADYSYIGIELSKEYCDISVARIDYALKDNDKLIFDDEVKEKRDSQLENKSENKIDLW